jgi:cobalamin transport system substrate-binding protein
MFRKLAAVLSIIVLLIGCSPSKPANSEKSYVVTSPEVAEIICLLEGGEYIIGITEECDYPEYLNQKKIIGNFGKVDFEKIVELNPSLVFTAGLEQELLAEELTKLGIKTEKIHSTSQSEMLVSILTIGEIIGRIDRSKFVVDSLKIEIQNLPTFTSNPKVYVEIYGAPIMSVSDKSFVGQLISISGGTNIFEQLPRDYSRIDPEKVIKANPDIIILTYPGVSATDVKNRKGWEVISALKSNRIYNVNDVNPDLILRASPRYISGIKELQKILHETN